MKKQNDVAMFLAEKVISAVAENSNFVFSPASINAALTMLASKDEPIRSSIVSFLRSYSVDELKAVYSEIATIVLADGSASGGPKISNVNGVWMDQSMGVDPSLKDLFENFFKATYALVDFRFKAEEVRKEVNAWGSKHTNGLIKDILPPGSVTMDTIYIFGNALYFKGTWEEKFPKSFTRDLDFHLLSGGSVSVPFMTNHKKQYVEEYKGFKVLKLPFRQSADTNRQFSMYFYLPDAKDGLNSLVKRVASSSSSSTCGFLDSHTPRKQVEVGQFRIPKFKIDFGFEASSAFNGLNLPALNLHHKALVEIDEDGAEAGAVTVIRGRGGRGFSRGRRIDFVADHPFLFMIREDKTGTVLFVGQIFDPSKSVSA
ncbi:Serpin domain-containing protein [Hirschfeldia incana]|nr:Serpin domain-containing protein [Hirschfeldia incana]